MAARGDRTSNDEAAVLRSDVDELAGRVSGVVPHSHFPVSMPPSAMPPSSETPLSLAPELLERVHQCFADLAGPDSGIDALELKRCLEVHNVFIAERVLAVFDRNSDGLVNRVEFVRGVPRLLFGSVLDKLRFAFRVHDLNGDGVIDRVEILRMLELGLSEDGLGGYPDVVRRFSEVLLAAADKNGDGRLSFREFELLAEHHPATTSLISRSDASWISPGGELSPDRAPAPTLGQRLGRFLDNRRALAVLVALWVIANVALFGHAVFKYQALGKNPYIQLARGAGACINLNGALIALTMARRALTWARGAPLLRHLPLDDSIAIHKALGATLFVFSLVHTVAHGTNWAVTTPSLWTSLWQSPAGRSGLALLVVFAAVWVFSRPRVRASGHFELFYWTHLLYVLWFALALVHGPVFWLWAGVPLLIFAVDRLLRLRSGVRTEVLACEPLASGVTKLTLEKHGDFTHRAGDYLYLKLPALAPHEWHPFTISSAPEHQHLTLHVRSLGNFTRALHELAQARSKLASPPLLYASLDGPFGTSSRRIFEARHAVLVAAGIGVTPFASVLESIVLRGRAGESPLEKVYFYWLNRDATSFEWFARLLATLESSAPDKLVDIRIFMTGGRGNVSATLLNLARAVAHDLGDPDVFTGLASMTNMGPPDWRAEVSAIAERHHGTAEVFFCGPPGLGRTVRGACAEFGLPFHQEQF